MERMTAFVALNNDTPVECDVIRRGAGAGETQCFECGGTGDWTPFHPDSKGRAHPLPRLQGDRPHLRQCLTCQPKILASRFSTRRHAKSQRLTGVKATSSAGPR